MDTQRYKMNASERPRRRVVAAPARRSAVALHAVRIVFESDPEPDTSYLNPEGLAAYERDEFSFLCVRAEADVSIEGALQVLESGSTLGVESDAEEYIAEVAAQEWGVLRKVLKTVGVPTEQLPLEVQDDWIEWRT